MLIHKKSRLIAALTVSFEKDKQKNWEKIAASLPSRPRTAESARPAAPRRRFLPLSGSMARRAALPACLCLAAVSVAAFLTLARGKATENPTLPGSAAASPAQSAAVSAAARAFSSAAVSGTKPAPSPAQSGQAAASAGNGVESAAPSTAKKDPPARQAVVFSAPAAVNVYSRPSVAPPMPTHSAACAGPIERSVPAEFLNFNDRLYISSSVYSDNTPYSNTVGYIFDSINKKSSVAAVPGKDLSQVLSLETGTGTAHTHHLYVYIGGDTVTLGGRTYNFAFGLYVCRLTDANGKYLSAVYSRSYPIDENSLYSLETEVPAKFPLSKILDEKLGDIFTGPVYSLQEIDASEAIALFPNAGGSEFSLLAVKQAGYSGKTADDVLKERGLE